MSTLPRGALRGRCLRSSRTPRPAGLALNLLFSLVARLTGTAGQAIQMRGHARHRSSVIRLPAGPKVDGKSGWPWSPKTPLMGRGGANQGVDQDYVEAAPTARIKKQGWVVALPDVIEKCLNRTEEDKTMRIYQRVTCEGPMRDA